MAGRFINPFPQFFNSTPTALSGAKLFFYAAGTATKLSTYSDRALSSANTNPVVLNSAGYPSTEIWLQDLDYKVVLAPSTDSDPPTSPIWSSDYVRARDSALVAKTLTGSGSPNGTVAGTAGSASILPDFYWDYTNLILYICTSTGTASTAVWTAINAGASASVPPPQGRLTPATQTPVLASDATASTAIYYTPYVGNLVPVYNGSTFVPTEFSELTLTLSASHSLSTIYDVFVFSNAGVLTLATGPAWTTSTAGAGARGSGAATTQLARVKGLWTNAVSMTGRNGATTYTIGANLGTYLGSIFIDGAAGQVTCHTASGQSRKYGVWNAYNRVPIYLKAADATATWAAGATLGPANGSTANSLTIFSGLPEEIYDLKYMSRAVTGTISANSAATFQAGLGYNSTTVAAGRSASSSFTTVTSNASYGFDLVSEYFAVPVIGINVITALERNAASGNITVTGTEGGSVLTAVWRG